MQQLSMKKKWVDFNYAFYQVWENVFIMIMCLAFVLSDWMIGIFSFSDYLFGALFLMMVLSNNFKIRPKQYKWLIIVLTIIVFNILQNYFINDAFILKTGLAGLFKITTYAVVITSFYNFIDRHSLEEKLMKSMNITALIVCLIGFYISLALYTNGNLPYEFFWHFTRTDSISYLFEGSENLYRIRSLFSEPSYLGYYLTIILGVNLFNKQNIKTNILFLLLLILTIISTFSYSSIGIMMLILVLQFFSVETFKNMKHKKLDYFYIVLTLIALGILIFITKDIIQVTLIDRTSDILAGKDSSASARLLESWQYINTNHLISGNGIGHTPDIWNVYAYFLSDLGVAAFLGLVLFSGYLVKINYKLGILFIALNFQKGGYLAAPFYILIVLIFIFAYKKKSDIRL
ncbi:hypothetical protein [Carnobacterium sp. ISL-102]|uniref:hypothetical protein n=1 Tax=Carnobacterium sp. ISL-102 TaxID=2819142 RepID=UPI001BE88C51|nr:hypothetical protein [Carnobacterium sp. ISL-102]MBT2731101.1 hypothetical protein [Carnobacterium sp. ISL-102]